jgi:hypothetical protein
LTDLFSTPQEGRERGPGSATLGLLLSTLLLLVVLFRLLKLILIPPVELLVVLLIRLEEDKGLRLLEITDETDEVGGRDMVS